MSSDPESFDLDLDDLLNQAEDLEPTETQSAAKPNRSARVNNKTQQSPVERTPSSASSASPPTVAEKPAAPSGRNSKKTSSVSADSADFIRLACSCGYRMRLKPNKAGEQVKCPKCEQVLTVPGLNQKHNQSHPNYGQRGFDALWEQLTKELARESENLELKKRLSGLALRSLRITVERVSTGKYDVDRIREAVEQLGESEDSRVYPLLEKLWEEEPPNLQSAILGAMGQVKDPRGTLFLLRLLKHPIPEIRLASVQSLAFTNDPRVVSLLVAFGQSYPELKYAVGDSLLKMKADAIDPVIELLKSQDPNIVSDAVILLGRLKTPDAIKPLMEVFQTHPGPIQGQVAEAFGLIGEPKCIPSLVPLLNSPDDKIRVQAASAMGRVPHPGCLKALIDALDDPNPEVRKRCSMALGEIGDKRAAPGLSKLLTESEPELKISAAEALGRIGDDRAVPYLIEMARDEDESVVLKALGALRKLKSPQSIEPLTQLLDHDSSRIRQRSIDVLGQVGDAVVAENLEQMLRNDRSEDVRAAAAKALGEIRDPGSVDSLIDALHGAFTVRCRAIVALGEIGEESALASLLAMLKDPAPEIRYHATQSLAQMKHSMAVRSIEPLLTDSNAMVRRGAAKALETLGQGDAEKLLGSSTQQGVRRVLQKAKNFAASISPGELADTIQHGSAAMKLSAAAMLLIPVLAFGAYYYISGAKSQTEKVALMRRGYTASIDLSADGKTLVSGRTTGVVEIWDLPSKKRLSIFQPETLSGEILGVSIVPDGQSLVLATQEIAGGFDRKSGKMLWVVDLHKQPIISFKASHDRKNFMLTDRSGLSSFWNSQNGEPIGVGAVTLPREFTQQTQLTNDASAIAAGGKGSIVKMWSTGTVEELAVFNLTQNSEAVALLFSRDDALLAIGDSAGYLTVYEVATGKSVYRTEEPEISYERPVLYQNLSFSEDGTRLLGMLGVQLFQLDIGTGEIAITKVPGLSTGTYGAQPGGSLFAIGSDEKSEIDVFDRDAGKKTGTLNE